MRQFSNKTFEERHIMTIGVEFASKVIILDDLRIKLQIWDTSGNAKFRTIITSYYRGTNICFIVFDVTDRNTFDSVKTIYNEIKNHTCGCKAIILVGNKCDLVEERKVSVDDAEILAEELEIPYIECSAKDYDSVEKVFTLGVKKCHLNPIRGDKNERKTTEYKIEENSEAWGKSQKSPYLEIYQKFKNLFDNKYLSDIIISVNGREYYCHKSIICQTQKLKKLIGDKKQLNLESGFELILEYIYSGKANVPIEEFGHILEMAFQFDLTHLYESLLEHVKTIRNENTLLNLFTKIRKNEVLLKKFIRNIKLKKKFFKENSSKLKEILNEKYDECIKMINDTEIIFGRSDPPIINHIKGLIKDDSFKDLILSTKDFEIKVHKVILYALNEYFENMFKSTFMESQQDRIEMEDVDGRVLDFIIHWIYKLNILSELPNEDMDIFFGILDFSRRINLDDKTLDDEVKSKIKSLVTVDNAMDVLEKCHIWMIPQFKEECMKVLNNDGIEWLLDTIVQLHIKSKKVDEYEKILKEQETKNREYEERIKKLEEVIQHLK